MNDRPTLHQSFGVNTLDPFTSINCPYKEVLLQVKQQLSEAGLRVLQTFELVNAHMDPADCPGRHDGTDECDCQIGVFLIYGEPAEPVSLILHGNDGQSWLSFLDNAHEKVDPRLQSTLEQALHPTLIV